MSNETDLDLPAALEAEESINEKLLSTAMNIGIRTVAAGYEITMGLVPCIGSMPTRIGRIATLPVAIARTIKRTLSRTNTYYYQD